MKRNLVHRNSWVARSVQFLALRDARMQRTHTDTGALERAIWAELLLKRNSQALHESSIAKLAVVVHHGGSARQIRLARSILSWNYRSGLNSTHILLHQMSDRICVMKYGKQKFGTQLHVVSGSYSEPFPPILPDEMNDAGEFYDCDRCTQRRCLRNNPQGY